MEEERLPRSAEVLLQFLNQYGEYFEYAAYLRPILLFAASVIILGSLFSHLAKKGHLPKWIERTALVAGIISIPFCLVHLFGAVVAIVLETTIGGFYGPGTSPQVYFIPSVLIDVFPIIGLAYLARTVRNSSLFLIGLSFVFLIYDPLLRWMADAS